MSDRDQEVVASLRRTYEAFSRGDFDTAIAVAHPEIDDMEIWAVWTLNDDGLVARIESFLPHQEADALEVAGLSE